MPERVFRLPDLGEGLEEGTITAWLVAEGDEVELNQPIAEIETAKAVVEMPSPFAGRIARLHVAAGAEAKVGALLVTFDIADADPAPSVTATPAVRKLAKDLGVDLPLVTGSGPGARVTREDVEAFARSGAETSVPAAGARAVPHSATRKSIVRQLSAVAAIPQVTTFRTLECSALEAFRRELDVSPLPVFVAALAAVCRDNEMLNASWREDAIDVHAKVNVGVATDTSRGLIVPVVRDAGARGIADIAAEIARLARAARDGGLMPAETTGATIAVSNTGSYGSEAGTPLLNPGHAVTVALGVIAPRALAIEDRVEARPACTLSLTFDHRVLDGATVGRGLTALVELLGSREGLETLPR